MAFPRSTKYRINDDGTAWVANVERKPSRLPQMGDLIDKFDEIIKDESKGDIILAILLAVRNILQTADSWSKIHRAVGPNGLATEPSSSYATKWSMLGALEAVTTHGLEKHKRDVIYRWKSVMPREWKTMLTVWEQQKDRKHSEVIRVLNMAVGVRKGELNGESRLK